MSGAPLRSSDHPAIRASVASTAGASPPTDIAAFTPASAIFSAADVASHCARTFAKWQLPDEVLFVDAVPLTSTGKLDKKAIRARLTAEGYVLPDLRKG